MAIIEAAKAEERERLKREKIAIFEEAVKANINEAKVKMKLKKTKLEEQKIKEKKEKEDERIIKHLNYEKLSMKKAKKTQTIPVKTEVVTKTYTKTTKVKRNKKPEPSLTVKQRYSPVSGYYNHSHICVFKRLKKSLQRL